jgi:hypothetical protein
MSPFGDDDVEMPRSRPLDDVTVDALLAGYTRGEDIAALSSFILDVRTAAETVPTPSPALHAALAAGFSTEQGDLPVTAASNVHGPAQQVAGLPKWRTARMKIKGFVVGLGLAGRVALGSTVAFAATTGAAAAGMLPGPIQAAMSDAVDTVSPFTIPDGKGQHSDKVTLPVVSTTTTKPKPTTTTTKPKPQKPEKPVVTPTTKLELPTPTTAKPVKAYPPVTEPKVEWPPVTEPKVYPPVTEPKPTTPTTKKPYIEPVPIVLECVAATTVDGSSITCEWSASTSAQHKKYVLYRMDGKVLLESGDVQTFVDTDVVAGQAYSYKVKSYDLHGNVVGRSDIIDVPCCG